MGNIRNRRLALNMTQTELGERVGVSKMTIHRWEVGISYPRADRAFRLAAALGCDIEELALEPPEAQNSA